MREKKNKWKKLRPQLVRAIDTNKQAQRAEFAEIIWYEKISWDISQLQTSNNKKN